METVGSKFQKVIAFAKANGFLSPLWLMPNSTSDQVQQCFLELEDFLRKAFLQGKVEGSIKEINDFMWELKKTYAFAGWDGIAPYLLVLPKSHHHFDQTDLESLF